MTDQTITRAALVSISNRRGGKAKIHTADCTYVIKADPFYVRSVTVRDYGMHRIYDVCQVCLKGRSTFSLPKA